jgi:hypothetical protein
MNKKIILKRDIYTDRKGKELHTHYKHRCIKKEDLCVLTKDIKRETRTLDASKRKKQTKVRIKKRTQKSIKERKNTEKYKRKKETCKETDRYKDRQKK